MGLKRNSRMKIHLPLHEEGQRLIGLLNDNLREEFKDDQNMLNAIDKSDVIQKTVFDYKTPSKQPDYKRAELIAEHEAKSEMLSTKDIADLLEDLCLLSRTESEQIAKKHWTRHLLDS